MANLANSWNDKVKAFFIKTKHYFKNNWKKILFNYLYFFAMLTALFILDFATKRTLFVFEDGSKDFHGFTQGEYDVDASKFQDFKIIGIRSVGHVGVTFMRTKNIAFIQTISLIIFISILIGVAFMRNLFTILTIGVVAAGDLGNLVDRFLYHGMVKDIFYMPWLDRGTFNFADVCLTLGCVIIVGYMIYQIIYEHKKKEKHPENSQNNDLSGESKKDEEQQNFNNNLKMS
ncbi:lipoprotein signal peptidase [Mycoplasmopsis californica]|uniref:Signal peptidase II n=1 Tax=Mycoplasmopsis equigenitalium TaxID=114883 RepID=A0ABY5J0G5_9BACT|nr:signal peptidase II [Mycoplasmopsis equigenitalium]UUD36752.1 signal peptidase II [Mycoplasmopsis equigenitalium]VEU69953.1 lipoprotein signal peptidase [Mycoplasmopsis californica]